MNINPHALARQFVFPPLLPGFRRERIAYHEDPNALEISFVVEDQETGHAAPAPATSWEGTYTMSFPQYGIACEQEIAMTLRADKNLGAGNGAHQAKRWLMRLAAYIIEAKLHWSQLRNGPNTAGKTVPGGNLFLTSATFQENLAENEIRVSVRAITKNARSWVFNLSQLSDVNNPTGTLEFGRPLPPTVSDWADNPRKRPYDSQLTTLPLGLSAPCTALLCILQNPCNVAKMEDGLFNPTGQIPELTASSAPSDAALIEYTERARYSESHDKAMYQYYEMSSELVTDTGWRAFPLGKQCTTGSSDDTVAFAHLHCPVQIRKVTVHAARINAWPELIKPVHWQDSKTSIKHVLAHHTVEPLPVQLSADGCDALHEVTATYWYYLSKPYKVESRFKMPVGRLPYVHPDKLSIGVVSAQGIDQDAHAVSDQFFLEPSDLLGLR